MKKWLVVLVLLAGCGGSEPPPRTGAPDVYERIESLTDCDKLLDERLHFSRLVNRSERDTPVWENSRSYIHAISERRKELNC